MLVIASILRQAYSMKSNQGHLRMQGSRASMAPGHQSWHLLAAVLVAGLMASAHAQSDLLNNNIVFDIGESCAMCT
jgi:hypothetical protein